MFTSRAEFRILLRQDNADLRLTERSHNMGLATDERMRRMQAKRNATSELSAILDTENITPEVANPVIVPRGTAAIRQRTKLRDLLLRPQLSYADIETLSSALAQGSMQLGDLRTEAIEQVEIGAKYDGYIEKERLAADKLSRLEDIPLAEGMDYTDIPSLSFEAREKLSQVRPRTLGQASRISGVSPADLSVLLVYLGR